MRGLPGTLGVPVATVQAEGVEGMNSSPAQSGQEALPHVQLPVNHLSHPHTCPDAQVPEREN